MTTNIIDNEARILDVNAAALVSLRGVRDRACATVASRNRLTRFDARGRGEITQKGRRDAHAPDPASLVGQLQGWGVPEGRFPWTAVMWWTS